MTPTSLRLVLLVVGLLLMCGQAEAQREAAKPIKVEGLAMVPYTAAGKGFSLLQPKGWAVQTGDLGVTIVKNPKDKLSARLDLFVIPLGASRLTTRQIVETLANKMKEQYPSFAVTDSRQLSAQPDTLLVMFSYTEGKTPMSGLALAASLGSHAVWADLYGRDSDFKRINPVILLTFVLQSMSQGATPSMPTVPVVTPAIKKAAAKSASEGGAGGAPAATAKKKATRSMLMAHYWNMYPHLYPGGVFRSAARWR